MLFTLARKSNHLRVFFCRRAPTAADYRQTVGRVGVCPSRGSSAAGDAVRIHQAQPPRRLDLVAAGEGSRRRSCLSREGPGGRRLAWGRAPIPPSGRGAHGWRFSEPAEAGGWLSSGANEGGGRRGGGNRGPPGQQATARRISRRRPCLSRDGPGGRRLAWGRAPIPPQRQGCPWLAFLGTRRGGRLVVCRRERRGRRAEGGNRGGRGQRARRRRSRAATWSASWGVSQ